MPEATYDLLTEALITVTKEDTQHRWSLPELLAALSRGEPLEFPSLRPHQQHPWHAFICQVAALAARHHLSGKPSEDANAWQQALLKLSGGSREAWCLVVDDLSKPGFLQPPVPEKSLEKFSSITTPDELDLLQTAKNHDVKSAQASRPTAELWMFALLTLQTSQGFSGRDNYGIARMNGGFGNRPYVAYVQDLQWSSRFKDDVDTLLTTRTKTIESFGYQEEGETLLWLTPWDGTTTLALSKCDPFFIEICRRVRLWRGAHSVIGAGMSPTKVPRLDGKDRKGDLGDIWTPIRKEDQAALTIGEDGFSYKKTQELIVGEQYLRAAAQRVPNGAKDLFFYAQALCRGQGKTDGYHERVVPIPGRVRSRLVLPNERQKLHALSKEQIAAVDLVRLKVLKPALCSLLQGGPSLDKLDYTDKRPARWLDAFEDDVDRVFFEYLWNGIEQEGKVAKQQWDSHLLSLSLKRLLVAQREAPVPMTRRYRAIAESERVFFIKARHTFPDATLPSNRRDNERANKHTADSAQ